MRSVKVSKSSALKQARSEATQPMMWERREDSKNVYSFKILPTDTTVIRNSYIEAQNARKEWIDGRISQLMNGELK